MSIRVRGERGLRRRQMVLRRDLYRCQKCGRGGRLEVDHVWPLWAGGEDRDSNLVTLCVPCHSIKTRHERRQRDRLRGVTWIGVDGLPVVR